MIHQERMARRTSGMTLIEIIVVITIIGLFVGLAGPGLFRWIAGAKEKKTQVRLSGLKSVITQFHSDTAQYPSNLLELVNRPADPKASARWRGPYVENEEKDLRDGWEQEIVYKRNPAGPGSSKRPFELYSWGANGEGSPKEEWIDVWNL